MTKPHNPIALGFHATWRDPAIWLLEILWRWTFAISALLLIFATGGMLLGPLHVGPSFSLAVNSRDASRLGIVLLSIVLRLGEKLIAALVVLPILVALIWSILASAARRITVRRLRPTPPPLRFRPMLALQLFRAFATWMAFCLLIGAIAGAIYIATHQSRPDPALFYAIAVPSVLVIGMLWLGFNWYLSVAAFVGQEGQGFRGAFRLARQAVRRQFSDFAGTGFVFLLLRVAVLMVVIAVCGLTTGMMTRTPESYSALVVAMALISFAVLDFLYVARMAAYLALDAAQPQSSEAFPVRTSQAIS